MLGGISETLRQYLLGAIPDTAVEIGVATDLQPTSSVLAALAGKAESGVRLRRRTRQAGEVELEREQTVGLRPVALVGVEAVFDALAHPRLAPDLVLPHTASSPLIRRS